MVIIMAIIIILWRRPAPLPGRCPPPATAARRQRLADIVVAVLSAAVLSPLRRGLRRLRSVLGRGLFFLLGLLGRRPEEVANVHDFVTLGK